MGAGGLDEGMAQFLGREPTPEDAAQFAEDYERLLARLGDETLRTIALSKLEGHTNEEIAAELGTSPRTVDRKLNLIRKIWEEEGTGMNPRPRAATAICAGRLETRRRGLRPIRGRLARRGSGPTRAACWPRSRSRRGRGCSASC